MRAARLIQESVKEVLTVLPGLLEHVFCTANVRPAAFSWRPRPLRSFAATRLLWKTAKFSAAGGRSLAFSKNDQLQKDPFSGSARKYHQYLLVEIVLKNDNHF